MTTSRARGLAASILLGTLCAVLLSTRPARAADAPAGDAAKAPPTPTETATAQAAAKEAAAAKEKAKKAAAATEPLEQIVITGSRIRKNEFTSDSPIQVIKKDQSVLAGLVTSTEVLQGSTVSGGGQQINSYFGEYVTDGGPGANTLSLRGLGAVRTLVLLNGRRLAPSGSRGSVGSADLNVLPSAMVDRIEILKDGASSIYGSDAVAGVVNIITRKGIKDWTIEGTQINTQQGGGSQTSLSVVGGHTWDRFELSGSVEYYERKNLAVGDRSWASCPTSVFIDPTTGQYDPGSILDPATGQPKCFPVGALNIPVTANDYIGAVLFDAQGNFVGTRWTPDSSVTSPIPGWRNVNPFGLRSGFTPATLNDSIISPTRNLTAFFNGSYDVGALGNAEAYFEALYARRESKQIGDRQLILDYQFDASNGFAGHPFVPPEITNAVGAALLGNPFKDPVEARAFVAFGNDTSRQTVNFTRAVAGLRGDLTFLSDWKYDANVTFSRAQAAYTFESFLTDRVYNSLYVVPASGPTTAPSRTVNGVTYVCASGDPTCVPAPVITAGFLAGNIDQAYRNYIFVPVTGHTTYDETTFTANADGRLFKLPAGDVRGAVGAEYRTLKLDDTPSADAINDNLYNFTASGVTKGKDAVRELYAEVEAPILRNLPMAESLTVNLSGRYTDYNSYGSDRTYKMGIGYTPVKWLKIRGTKGSSFRAPALFEQYLSPTSGFLSTDADPCNDYGQKPVTSPLYINCASEGLPPNFSATNGVQVNSAGGAALGLKSEKSHADTVGFVLQPSLPTAVGDLAFAVDWWRIAIRNQVAQIGGSNLLKLCYNDPQFRAGGSYCAYSTRDANGQLVVNDNYINIATQIAEGVDYNVRYTREIGVGELTTDLRATRYILQDNKLLPTDPFDHLNGTLQNPKWVGDADIRYKWKDYTLRYGLTYVGAMDSTTYLGKDPATTVFNYKVSSYMTHDLSLRYQSPNKWEIIGGVRNFTDATPKTISDGQYDRVGNSLLYSGYDYFGRRLFLTLSKTF